MTNHHVIEGADEIRVHIFKDLRAALGAARFASDQKVTKRSIGGVRRARLGGLEEGQLVGNIFVNAV